MLKTLSEQELVDCSSDFGNAGCGGGWMSNGEVEPSPPHILTTLCSHPPPWSPLRAAFSYMKQRGLCTGDAYPYTSGTSKSAGSCSSSCAAAPYTQLTSFSEILNGAQNSILTQLNASPLAVAITATSLFQQYVGGMITQKTSQGLNHAVLLCESCHPRPTGTSLPS